MKFSTMCDYAGRPGVAFYVVKTGTKNIRILESGQPRDKSFVVPITDTSNRRPAGAIETPREEEAESPVEFEDAEFLPQ